MTSLPAARAAFIDPSGRPTPQFYRFLETLTTAQAGNVSPDEITAINAQLAELQAEIAALPSAEIPKLQVTYPILSQGLLQNGFAKLALNQPGDSGAGALKGITLDAWGRVTGTTDATITGTAGRVTVANGDAAAGPPTIDLAEVADTGGGSLLKFVRDAWGRITGTSTPVVADLKSAGLVVPQGYIDGLQMVWDSATSISVTSGTAYIPSLGNVLSSNATLTLSGLSLAASTWYHVYLYSNAGTPAIECVTTAPANYYGTAYQKTGDASRRYVGSVLTDASSNIRNFKHSGSRYSWMQNVANGLDVFRILSNGKAITATAIDASGAMSETAFSALLRGSNLDTSIPAYIMAGDYIPSSTTDGQISLKQNLVGFFEIASDISQRFKYQWTSAPTGGLYLDLIAFNFAR